MKKIIALSAILIGLVGCSSSDDPVANLPATLTNALLNGTWESGCLDDDPDSFTVTATFNNGDGIADIMSYDGNLNCTGTVLGTTETFTYTIGSDVTVDGSVAGITTATQINITDTTPGSLGETDYDIFAITNLITLYSGNTDGANDGSTPALRPTQLIDIPFTKL